MIRILKFTGGLGNQIFGYAVYQYFRNKYPKDKLYICYGKDLLNKHNGYFELPLFFDVDLPKPNILYIRLWYIMNKLRKFINIDSLFEMAHPIIQNEKAIFYYAYRNNKIYIPQNTDWIKFKEPHLSEQNAEVLRQIKSTDSVFIHVRRGDYLSPLYIKRFNGICTPNYYNKAISIIQEHLPQAKFLSFQTTLTT